MLSPDRPAPEPPDAAVLLIRALGQSWPILETLTPASLGLDDGEADLVGFVTAVRQLSDEGLISYEALIVSRDTARLVDAGLTARGRASIRPGARLRSSRGEPAQS